MVFRNLVRRRRNIALIALAALVCVAAWFFVGGQPPRLSPDELPADQPVVAADRVVIVAPHCDDETLGAGGLLHDAALAGAEVHVIMVTNGDGFRYAVEAERRTLRPPHQAYVQYAYERQQETLAAVKLLGLPPGNVTFLGYPDGGIARMWSGNWERSNPVRSQFTGLTSSPYKNSFTPGAPYAGEQLAADLAALLHQYRPTLLVFPHPNDAHPDHWAVNAFVNYVLQGLREQGDDWTSSVRQRLYLVHRGEWPNPKRLNMKMPLLPPRTLLNTQTHWLKRTLDSNTVSLKHEAILAYHSQVLWMSRYLLSFARQNELYGELAPANAPLIAGIGSGPATSLPPPGLVRATTDPASDTLARQMEPGADILFVDAGRSDTHLLLSIGMRGAVTPDVTYNVHLVPLGLSAGGARARLDLSFVPPGSLTASSPAGIATAATGAAGGKIVNILVPLSELGTPSQLYISADTSVGKLGIDRAAWTLVNLADVAPTRP